VSSGAPTRDKLCRTRIKRSKTGGLRARSDPVDLTYARSRHRRAQERRGQGTAGIQRSDIADANNLSLMAFSTESACSTEQ
jgi:hypothetical protein